MKEEDEGKREYRMVARADATAATRARIMESTGALLWRSGGDGFSLEDVARDAATTVQTVLRHFGSKEGLIEATVRYGGELVIDERGRAPIGDVRGAVQNLIEHYERYGDVVIRMLAEEHRSPFMLELTERGRQLHREWVKRTFAPQLKGLRGAVCNRRVAQLVVVCDVYVWKLFRRDMDMNVGQTEAAVVELIERLVATE